MKIDVHVKSEFTILPNYKKVKIRKYKKSQDMIKYLYKAFYTVSA